MDQTINTETEAAAANRTSLLDVVLNSVEQSGKNYMITRLIYVAHHKIRQSSADRMTALVHKKVEKLEPEQDVTGILIVHPYVSVHMLEGTTGFLMSFLRELATMPSDESYISEGRVISCTEDVPARVFSNWYSCYTAGEVNLESAAPVAPSLAVKTAVSVNDFLRKLGADLADLGDDDEVKRRLAKLQSAYEDCPSTETLLSLCPAEDAPTLDEFLEIFDSPLNVDLESEKVWPMAVAVRL